jgi:hypothetical protein
MLFTTIVRFYKFVLFPTESQTLLNDSGGNTFLHSSLIYTNKMRCPLSSEFQSLRIDLLVQFLTMSSGKQTNREALRDHLRFWS